MEVADARRKEKAPCEAQHWIAKRTMQKRHRSTLGAAAKPMADDHRIAGAQTIDERIELRKIVAIIGVCHDNKLSMGRGNSTHQRIAVTLLRDGHDPRSSL